MATLNDADIPFQQRGQVTLLRNELANAVGFGQPTRAAAARAALADLRAAEVPTSPPWSETSPVEVPPYLTTALAGKVSKGSLIFNVNDYGAVGDGVTDDKLALGAAFVAASAVYGQVLFPPGTYVVTGTFPLSGYHCSIIGSGSSYTKGGSAKPVGTVIKAVAQTGPVLDFTDFIWPGDYRARLRFEGFVVQGDGTAGVANKGIYCPPAQYPIAVAFRDISVTLTGGIAVDISDMYLSELDAITVTTPIASVANNVPYVRLAGCNGMRITGLGLRSTSSGGIDDVPAAGALLLQGTAYFMHDNLFVGLWLENLHVGDGKAAIVATANAQIFADPQIFDTFKVSGAANTAIFRFQPADILDVGGNIVRGVIIGHGTNVTEIDYGVDLLQNNNRVEGVKGYRGNNVRIAVGVTGSYVHLGGSFGTSTLVGVEDNSGNTANTCIDEQVGTHRFGAFSGSASLSFGGATERAGAGSPESAVVGAIGDTYRRTDGAPSGTLYVKSKSGGLNVGWLPVITENLAAGTVSASQSIPFQSNTGVDYTLAGSPAFTSIGGARTGGVLTIILRQDATGGRTVTWPSSVKWRGGATPVLSTAPAAVDTFVLMFDGANWRELSRSMSTVGTAITAAATQTASYVQADVQSIATAVNAIIAALKAYGITV